MNCPNCGDTLSERGTFCKACGAQARCTNCKTVLELGAVACVECGTKVGGAIDGVALVGNAPPARNIFTYREHEHGRDFNVDFSDTTMQSVGDVLGAFFASRGIVTKRDAFKRNDETEIEPQEKLLPAPTVTIPPASAAHGGDLASIAKIFRKNGDALELIDRRLKAKSGTDFVRRLTYLFIYAHELHGRITVSKANVIAILKDGKVWDGNSSKWLKKKELLRPSKVGDEDHLELIATSRDQAKKVLVEFLNDTVKDEWNPDTRVKHKRTKNKKD